MIVALASPRPAVSVEDGIARMRRLIAEAAGSGAAVVCFPEAWLPGLRGQDFAVLPWDAAAEARVLAAASDAARQHRIAVIAGFEHLAPAGRQIAAAVFGEDGASLGVQTKNQLDPTEDAFYVPGESRRMFEVKGLKFGISICHEAWRYPETVRWAAVRGAKIVFQPQHTGSEITGAVPVEWGARGGAYYEQAMLMRSRENTIYFASVNYALRFPESATSLIGPSGQCEAYLPYGEEGVLVHVIDPGLATGLLAQRFAPERDATAT